LKESQVYKWNWDQRKKENMISANEKIEDFWSDLQVIYIMQLRASAGVEWRFAS
jgi:hypothetical protein